MRNKKSQGEDLLSMIAAIAFIVFIAIIFSLRGFYRDNEIKKNIEFEIINKNSNPILINYLRMPVGESSGAMADEINSYFLAEDEALLKNLRDASGKFFSGSHLETDYSSWILRIWHPERKKEIVFESERIAERNVDIIEVSSAFIPVYRAKEPIEVKLFLKRISAKDAIVK